MFTKKGGQVDFGGGGREGERECMKKKLASKKPIFQAGGGGEHV